MVEKLNSRPEQLKDAKELESVQHENQERLAEKLEKDAEKLKAEREASANEQEARHEALEQAKSKEDEQPQVEKAPEEEKAVSLTQKDLDARFNKTLEHIQKDMTPASKAFSKVIHNPVVDKASEAVGRTIARPNLILAGGIGTLTIGLAVYLFAKNYGYVLSGFEAMGSFIIGWAIGALVEFIRVGFKNKRSL